MNIARAADRPGGGIMGEFFVKLFNQAKEIFNKLDTTKKIIVGAVLGVVVVAFIVLFSVSSGEPNVVLFSELSSEDFGQVTKKLEEMGYHYDTSGTTGNPKGAVLSNANLLSLRNHALKAELPWTFYFNIANVC